MLLNQSKKQSHRIIEDRSPQNKSRQPVFRAYGGKAFLTFRSLARNINKFSLHALRIELRKLAQNQCIDGSLSYEQERKFLKWFDSFTRDLKKDIAPTIKDVESLFHDQNDKWGNLLSKMLKVFPKSDEIFYKLPVKRFIQNLKELAKSDSMSLNHTDLVQRSRKALTGLVKCLLENVRSLTDFENVYEDLQASKISLNNIFPGVESSNFDYYQKLRSLRHRALFKQYADCQTEDDLEKIFKISDKYHINFKQFWNSLSKKEQGIICENHRQIVTH